MYCAERYSLYEKRKQKNISDLNQEILKQSNKVKFLEEVLSRAIDIKEEEEKLIVVLEERGYEKFSESYDYLLTLPVRTMTIGRLEELRATVEKLREKLRETEEKTEKNMWEDELLVFEKQYQKFVKSKKPK
jgi:DNA topoisomerase-2